MLQGMSAVLYGTVCTLSFPENKRLRGGFCSMMTKEETFLKFEGSIRNMASSTMHFASP